MMYWVSWTKLGNYYQDAFGDVWEMDSVGSDAVTDLRNPYVAQDISGGCGDAATLERGQSTCLQHMMYLMLQRMYQKSGSTYIQMCQMK